MVYGFFLKNVPSVRSGTIRPPSIFVPINASSFLDFYASFVWKLKIYWEMCPLQNSRILSLLVQILFKPSLSQFFFFSPKFSFGMITMNELLPCPSLFVLGKFPANLTVKIILDVGFTLNKNLMTFSALMSFNKVEQPPFSI